MPDLPLQTATIIDLLGHADFYTACPNYLFLREQALAAVDQYRRAVADKEAGCDGCDQKYRDESVYVAGVVSTFVRITRELHALRTDQLLPVRDYLAHKLGYQPGRILLTYKEHGTKRVLEF